MKVSVQLFAIARQAVGRNSIEIELPDGATVGLLRQRLAAEVPALASHLRGMMFAVDASYADNRTVIPPGAEIACIPPVSGG